MQKIIEIQPTGSYFEVDVDGFLINPASLEKIQPEWRPVINDVIELYKKQYGDRLKNVYIRGSVAKGEAILGVSDLDSFAYVDLSVEELKNNQTTREGRKQLEEKYPFIPEIEQSVSLISEIDKDMIFLNQSVCVYGESVVVKKLKIGKDLLNTSEFFAARTAWLENFLENETDLEEIKKSCSWYMKTVLRTGLGLVLERSQKYTRDLYLCYESFSHYYPEKETEMREVLYLALNPIDEKEKIQKIMNGLGAWMATELFLNKI